VATIRELIFHWRSAFAAAGVESPRLNIELLIAHVLGVGRGELRAMGDDTLSTEQRGRLFGLCARRAKREPIDYLIGHRDFYGRRFDVKPGVLVPRPETEQIIELARQTLPQDFRGWAADVGCGSGALAVTLAAEFPNLRVVATDLYPTPLAVTRDNARRHGVGARVLQVRMDGMAALAAGPLFDLILSNPPYVTPEDYTGLEPEVHDHEPKEALVGGKGGVETPLRLLGQIAPRLKPGAFVMMEHGMNQGATMRDAASKVGLKAARTETDFANLDRILVAHA